MRDQMLTQLYLRGATQEAGDDTNRHSKVYADVTLDKVLHCLQWQFMVERTLMRGLVGLSRMTRVVLPGMKARLNAL